MAASSQKPLPAIPASRSSQPHLTTLTVDSQAHLVALIQHILSEHDSIHFEDGGKEAWARALKHGLLELGDNISRGGWLAGLKRRRKALKSERAKLLEVGQEEAAAGESNEDLEKVKVKKKPVQGTAVALDQGPSSSEPRGPFAKTRLPHSRNIDTARALEQIRDLANKLAAPTPKPTPKHLLLTVAPLGSRLAIPAEDSGFDLVPANVACLFISGIYSLPDSLCDDAGGSVLLYGLDEWDVDAHAPDQTLLQLVGGTFTLKGVTSPVQHNILCKVLRIAIYIHLSLVLEQHVLASSGVELRFPKPKMSPTIPHAPLPGPPLEQRQGTRHRHYSHLPGILGTGILSYFSKKTGNLLHRSGTAVSKVRHGSPLDLTSPLGSKTVGNAPSVSLDEGKFGARLRRFSLLGERTTVTRSLEIEISKSPFSSALRRIDQNKNMLSTSVGVTFSPPTLIVELAEKEKLNSARRLKADERAGLSSLLGWDGKDYEGAGMTGTAGFVQQQQLSTLYSQQVPTATPPQTQPNAGSPSASLSASSSNPVKGAFHPCDRARWITFRYYSRHRGSDRLLGEAVSELCSGAQAPCDAPGCNVKRGQHQLRFIHGGIRVSLDVQDDRDDGREKVGEKQGKNANGNGRVDTEKIDIWESCSVCGERTKRKVMNDGTFLFSFGKFLELLIYSPIICTLTPSLCSHTTTPPRPWPLDDFPLPRSRLNIVRHFAYQSRVVSFSLSAIEDVFELRVPRLQIVKGEMGGGDNEHNEADRGAASPVLESGSAPDPSVVQEKKVLRREIKAWWQGVADHMDILEDSFAGDNPETSRKALPRLPSEDDAGDDFEDTTPTPRGTISGLPSLSTNSPRSPSMEEFARNLALLPSGSSSPTAATLRPVPSLTPGDPTQLLSNMRSAFQRAEQALYSQLARTPIISLNDVRRNFHSAAKGARKRLVAWQNKHLGKNQARVGKFVVDEPEWWRKGCHALPGGNVIVREDDWGSIIAFTINSADYRRELVNLSSPQPPAGTAAAAAVAGVAVQQVPLPSAPPASNMPSFFSNKLFASSALALPDPDQEGAVWHDAEEYSASISRKEHPRDPTSLLPFRDVLRQKAPADAPTSLPSSRFDSLSLSPTNTTLRPSALTSPAERGQTAAEVSRESAGGELNAMPETAAAVGQILQVLQVGPLDLVPRPPSAASTDASVELETTIRRGHTSSIVSVDSNSTAGPDDTEKPRPPTPPTKQNAESSFVGTNSELATPTPSTFANTLTSSLGNAMRYVLTTAEQSRLISPFKNQQGLLSTENLSIDDRPHIKYDWTIGKRVKFSCTVYYAKQFDGLRKRCGIEDVFAKSLGRSANWAAEGGKSRSNFWKTSDDRFIIKTLVNAWNVADLQVLIDLAPSYFRYVNSTTSRPTVLAKLLGFYTVEIKNLETGNTQVKADLLVMENLFYDQKITKTFDLKGIQGRKVKPGSSGGGPPHSKTMFDGEWIEGQQRALMLVRPHSKVVLRDAVRSDCDFLSKSNIMDYSLLLGVDEERKEIACGLVDTIGSYTFAKTLEYKAKQGLSVGKEITVIPPAEYQDRFMSAMEGYFLACPDKWSRPPDEPRGISDPSLLPSVL